jgi:hypothetical protein
MKRKRTKPETVPTAIEEGDADRELIEACMTAGECLAARDAIFKLDPDGNSKYAERLIKPIDRRIEKALTTAAKLNGHGLAALNAQARLARALIKDEISSSVTGGVVTFTELGAKFLQVFTAETEQMMDALSVAPGCVIDPRRWNAKGQHGSVVMATLCRACAVAHSLQGGLGPPHCFSAPAEI